jgi:hypothetical protein
VLKEKLPISLHFFSQYFFTKIFQYSQTFQIIGYFKFYGMYLNVIYIFKFMANKIYIQKLK